MWELGSLSKDLSTLYIVMASLENEKSRGTCLEEMLNLQIVFTLA